MSSWQSTCRIQKVRQRDRFGCGVACSAMIAGWPYDQMRNLFADAGIGARKKRPLATNFSDLQYTLRALGIESQLKRWSNWDSLDGVGIVAVNNAGGTSSRNWHWVVVERHATFGIVIHDPDYEIPCFQSAPRGVRSIPLAEYEPRKSWIRVQL
ncbi:MAG: hypothetical protein R3260_00025 [Pseudomonas sp.]|nr:hypothetical protein [Pseudomonas sp.]